MQNQQLQNANLEKTCAFLKSKLKKLIEFRRNVLQIVETVPEDYDIEEEQQFSNHLNISNMSNPLDSSSGSTHPQTLKNSASQRSLASQNQQFKKSMSHHIPPDLTEHDILKSSGPIRVQDLSTNNQMPLNKLRSSGGSNVNIHAIDSVGEQFTSELTSSYHTALKVSNGSNHHKQGPENANLRHSSGLDNNRTLNNSRSFPSIKSSVNQPPFSHSKSGGRNPKEMRSKSSFGNHLMQSSSPQHLRNNANISNFNEESSPVNISNDVTNDLDQNHQALINNDSQFSSYQFDTDLIQTNESMSELDPSSIPHSSYLSHVNVEVLD